MQLGAIARRFLYLPVGNTTKFTPDVLLGKRKMKPKDYFYALAEMALIEKLLSRHELKSIESLAKKGWRNAGSMLEKAIKTRYQLRRNMVYWRGRNAAANNPANHDQRIMDKAIYAQRTPKI